MDRIETTSVTYRLRLSGVAMSACLFLAAGFAFAQAWLKSPELLDKIKPGITTAQEVEQILGRPVNRSSFPRLGLTSMDYMMVELGESYEVGITIDGSGVVKEVQKIRRYKGGGP